MLAFISIYTMISTGMFPGNCLVDMLRNILHPLDVTKSMNNDEPPKVD